MAQRRVFYDIVARDAYTGPFSKDPLMIEFADGEAAALEVVIRALPLVPSGSIILVQAVDPVVGNYFVPISKATLPAAGIIRARVVAPAAPAAPGVDATPPAEQEGSSQEDAYWNRLSGLPAPSSCGKIWPDLQEGGNPLFNCLRPHSAQGTSPALMHAAFAEFLDLVHTVPLDSDTCNTTLKLVADMSASYLNTNGEVASKLLEKHCASEGSGRGGEKERARIMRQRLLELMNAIMENKFPTIEPSSVCLMDRAETDGSCCCYDKAGKLICQILILEGKGDLGQGGGNVVIHLTAYYAKIASSNRHSPAVKQTCFPALGFEFYGNSFRVHALYLTDKVNCQPLTPTLYLSDMRMAVPEYLEQVARTLKATMLTLDSLATFYKPFQDLPAAPSSSGVSTPAGRDPELRQGIPYMLRGRFVKVVRLRETAHVYVCTDAKGKVLVAKVLPGQKYPWQLHAEMAAKGLAPQLLQPALSLCAGGFSLLMMEYLAPDQGWQQLDAFSGDAQALKAAASTTLKGLQSCLEGDAVHGDLRGPNLLAKAEEEDKSSAKKDDEPSASAGTSGACSGVLVKVIDFDWGGKAGEACYPAFINPEVKWPIEGPVGQAILQEHDTWMLEQSLARCPALQMARGADDAPGAKRPRTE